MYLLIFLLWFGNLYAKSLGTRKSAATTVEILKDSRTFGEFLEKSSPLLNPDEGLYVRQLLKPAHLERQLPKLDVKENHITIKGKPFVVFVRPRLVKVRSREVILHRFKRLDEIVKSYLKTVPKKDSKEISYGVAIVWAAALVQREYALKGNLNRLLRVSKKAE